MTLETPRLTLREAGKDDAAFLVALRTDAAVRRYLGGALTLDAATTLAEHNIAHSHWLFVAARRDNGEPVGLVMLHPGHGGIEISYQFAPSAWQRGFATEAVGRVIDHAFATEGISELLAVTQTANDRSRRLLARLGLTAAGEFEEFGEPQILYRARRPTPASS